MSGVQSLTRTQELLDGFGEKVMIPQGELMMQLAAQFIKVFINTPKQKNMEGIKVALWRLPLKCLFCVSYVVKTATGSVKGKGSLCPFSVVLRGGEVVHR